MEWKKFLVVITAWKPVSFTNPGRSNFF